MYIDTNLGVHSFVIFQDIDAFLIAVYSRIINNGPFLSKAYVYCKNCVFIQNKQYFECSDNQLLQNFEIEKKMFCPENTIVGYHDTLFQNLFTSISFLFAVMLNAVFQTDLVYISICSSL